LRQPKLTLPGYPLPLGVKLDRNGAHFSILSRHATSVTLLLFSSTEPESPVEKIDFDPQLNKTGDIWHIWVEGIREGQLFGYLVDGPYAPEEGLRFNKNKLILDPHARAVSGNFKWDLSDARGYDPASPLLDLSFSEKVSISGAPKCIVVNTEFDWFDRQLKGSFQNAIIYEVHVKGFTYDGSSSVKHPGTFRGLSEKIPYLKELGVTAVELMPIQEFDEHENTNVNPVTGERLKNYWGYSTFSFFAPRGMYSSSGTMGEQYAEFKEMVRDFHDAGIEVILDIVFNHTAEGDHLGPTMCFRGIDNPIYYMLEENKRFYKNFSGCGNTSILGRNQDGTMLSNPPLLEHIAEDPILRNSKIIAEAWDAGGAYQVGDFPGRWAEWNGQFRDDVRRFWRGDPNCVGKFATRLTGSSDLYDEKKSPLHGINFITCHDGFTLNDLVSFSEKHNIENGEDNRDGENYNISCNHGIEGFDVPAKVERDRECHIKNLIAALFLSQGVPMLLAGDEFRRTQRGNNNAYCQDNVISWVNWALAEKNAGLVRFCREIIRFRKEHIILRKDSFFTGGEHAGLSGPDICWHGSLPDTPDWSEESRFIACCINGSYAHLENGSSDCDIYMAFNASPTDRLVTLPFPPSGGGWFIAIDTSMESPDDIPGSGGEKQVGGLSIPVRSTSTVVLVSRH
jgi:isoamylase